MYEPRPSPGGWTERACRALVGLAALLVPEPRRAGWREEWASEIWHHLHLGDGMDPGAGARLRLLSRCLGALPHALWIRGEEWNVETVWQDVRFALRTLAKRPAFTLVAVGTLALGIGANTAVFGVLDAVVLRPLPMPTAGRLLWMWGRTYQGEPIASVSPPDFLDYREGTGRVFEELAAWSSFSRQAVYSDGEQPEELTMRSSTANYLAALGLQPALGRTFTPEEEAESHRSSVMISHGLWERLYAGAPDAVGRTLRLDGASYTIVGVLPEELGLQDQVDVWTPLTFGHEDYQSRGAHFLRPIGLLRHGVTRTQAQEALDRVSARLEAAFPETNEGWYPLLEPVQEVLLGSTRPALLVMMGAVALVLLIACANVGSLLIARSAERRGELAVRTALGASRARVTRQLLVESVILSLLAAGVGLAIASAGIAAFERLAPGGLPRLDAVAMSGRVLALTLAVSVAVGTVFGIMPALGSGGEGLAARVAATGRGRSGRRGGRLRATLVTVEVALSFVLLVGAALLMRSFLALSAVDPGFDPRDVLALPLSIQEEEAGSSAAVVAALDRIRAEVVALPGVAEVAFANILPMSGSGGDTYVYAEGRPPEQIRNVENTAEFRIASETYFDALGIGVLRGRPFTAADAGDTDPVVVVNQRLADRLFPGEDPLGRGLVIWLDTLTTHRIVGVVGDVHQYSPGRTPRDEFWLAERQLGGGHMTMVVKGRSGLPSAAEVRRAVWSVDPTQPLSRASAIEDYVSSALAPGRFQSALLGVFAVLALLLAAVGLYGLLAQTVAERRAEIGVRVALGAERSAVVTMMVRRGMALTGLGLAIGAVGALGATRLLGALLYGVGPRDPLAFALTPLLLALVALVASWIPARRAARLDPVQALRAE